jgi:IS1 family transposase
LFALFLCVHGFSLRTVAQAVRADVHAVYRWIRDYARENYEKPVPSGKAVVVELDEMRLFLQSKKNKCWIWKAYCRDTGELIDWECGRRDRAAFRRFWKRLSRWNVSVFFSDYWNVYSDIIPQELLLQTKRETRLIESSNFPQRHWFAGFRRKTCCVSRSLEMVDLTTMLYAKCHVNGSIII